MVYQRPHIQVRCHLFYQEGGKELVNPGRTVASHLEFDPDVREEVDYQL